MDGIAAKIPMKRDTTASRKDTPVKTRNIKAMEDVGEDESPPAGSVSRVLSMSEI
jgi:hypothetical protein